MQLVEAQMLLNQQQSDQSGYDFIRQPQMSILMHNSACVHMCNPESGFLIHMQDNVYKSNALTQSLCAFKALLCRETCSQVCSSLRLPDIFEYAETLVHFASKPSEEDLHSFCMAWQE